jgi:hypothetical protein
MRMILAACLTLGAVSLISTARAEDPYWKSHHDAEWQNRSEFKGSEFTKNDWLRDHCIRDWSGHEMCRR